MAPKSGCRQTNEHSDWQLGIDRGAADRGIVWRQLGSDPGQIENTSNGANQVIVRDDLLEIERIEQLSLILAAPAHHHQSPPMFASADGITVRQSIQMTFATKSALSRHEWVGGWRRLLTPVWTNHAL